MATLTTNQNSNFYGSISEKINNMDVNVLSLNAGLNSDATSFTLNLNILNKDGVSANTEDVQTQINNFLVQLRTKMTEMGYKVTI